MGRGRDSNPIPTRTNCVRLQSLMETAGNTIPGPDARHHDWSAFAYRWSELGVLWSETAVAARSEMGRPIDKLRTQVDQAFLAWMERRYAGLHNQPPDPPAMVHHLPRYLGRRLSGRLSEQGPRSLSSTDSPSISGSCSGTLSCCSVRGFAFVKVSCSPGFRRSRPYPGKRSSRESHRSISRRASGPLTWEASLWTRFWTDSGLTAPEVGYAKGLGDSPLDNVRELLSRPRIRILGLVVDKVDRIMHGMKLGAAGMHNQVRQWADERFMAELLDALFDGDFRCFPDLGSREYRGGRLRSALRRRDRRPPGRTRADIPRSDIAVAREGKVPGRGGMARPWGFPRTIWALLAPRPVGFRPRRRTHRGARRHLSRRGHRPDGANRAGDGMKRGDRIGFSQRIQLDWLEYTTNLVLAGNRRGRDRGGSERTVEGEVVGRE